MGELKIIGKQSVAGVSFTGIEGGFGEGKRALLLKELSEIHDQELKELNRRINENRKRFIDGKDIIDLLSGSNPLREFAKENGWIGSNRAQNVFILSERGYSKLLKILEDDKAWELYDQFVDDYFQMRQQLDTSKLSPELQMFNTILQSLAKAELEQKQLANEVQGIREVVALNSADWRKDANTIINKVAQKRGGFQAYQDVRNEVYQEVERRGGFQLNTRLTNKRRRLADEGVSKSRRDKLTKVDVIGDDKRLIEIYLAVVKEFAIANKVEV